MNRWTSVNLILALLVAALLTLHLWPWSGSGLAPLTELGPAEIELIRVERGDRLQLALRRGNSGWRLMHPHEGAAAETRVQQLLAIARAQVQHEYPADEALARYGLDSPRAVLQLDQERLLFGNRDPSQNNRYVLVADRVRVIDDLYFSLLSLPTSHFVTD